MTTIARRCLTVVCLLLTAAGAACSSRREPELSPETYREAVTDFYVGLSALQTTQDVLAREKFDRVVAIVPQEPAGWANRGVLMLRQQELDGAAQEFAHAATIAPESGAIQRLQALTESRRGNLSDAITHWRRAVELDANDLEAAYALALDIERQGTGTSDAEAQHVLEQLLAGHDNLAARLEYARIAAKREDGAALANAIAPLADDARSWSPLSQEQLKALQSAMASGPRSAAVPVTFLKNVLLREPVYQSALADVSTPFGEGGRPLSRFLRLKNPEPEPAPVDAGLTFAVQPLTDTPPAAGWIGGVSLNGEGNPVIGVADAQGIHVPGLSGVLTCRAGIIQPSDRSDPDAVAVADLNYDFRMDFVLAGAGGICLLQQGDNGRLLDVTPASRLPSAVLRAPAAGVWPADIDTDGDLDLVLASRQGRPTVLRNNGDGTFEARDLFPQVTRARGFVWADFDGDGVPDAAFLDASGAVQIFINLRGGHFRAEPLPRLAGPARAIAAATQLSESRFGLLVLASDGAIAGLSYEPRNGGWTSRSVAHVDPLADLQSGAAKLLTADLDNNGALDLVVASGTESRVLLGAPDGAFSPLSSTLALGAQAALDLDGDGRLELIGLDQAGHPVRAASRGTKSYRWQTIRPRAIASFGDQRINSFAIGGEIELRSGLHLQKQTIGSPIVHFGLGDAEGAEVARITWPNGVLQAEFNLTADRSVNATQRLKGSCPWLFAWNGREMSFVTDVLWRSPLGLRINAQTTAETPMTEDWVRVRGDQLMPRQGSYDLRITAELWETHFFDLVSLLVVDHKPDTEVFVDERFATPGPKLAVVPTHRVQPFASVRDDRGGDISELAAAADSRFIDFAGRGAYQGITRPHFVEMELPEDAPRNAPLWLVAQGWIHPTDSSINVAIGQGTHPAPEGLSLHVADASGRFREVRTGLGFPAGKDKTVLIDLTGVFGATGPRKLRLATNLEIFWDRLGWAAGQPEAELHTRRLELTSADLVYRGYSAFSQSSPSAPERPAYTLVGTGSRWLDLEGYYTRFGDVRPLLTAVDDRYVIMNAGDELRLRFPEAPAPPAGFVRDFVAITDGWEKDGDYNTTFSRTVLPLPTHRSARYDTPPGRLEDDPVYRQHQADFAEYHTRYVTSEPVRDALLAPPAHHSTP